MGAYIGTKVGARVGHIAYDYQSQSVWLINHSLKKKEARQILIDLIDSNGKRLSSNKVKTNTAPNSSKHIRSIDTLARIKDISFLRLTLRDPKAKGDLSRNVYWLSPIIDKLNWSESTWYFTPVIEYAN